jgi:hypothetical protein
MASPTLVLVLIPFFEEEEEEDDDDEPLPVLTVRELSSPLSCHV